jgi:hypothetical protein
MVQVAQVAYYLLMGVFVLFLVAMALGPLWWDRQSGRRVERQARAGDPYDWAERGDL